ncbi:MAG TPA: FmdE family protein [Anaerolineae bacterium]|nr:FmdE family protein [Anaerolineae bacterium]
MEASQGMDILDIEGARRFHGHSCPGLAIGIRAAEVVLQEIGAHAEDEEIVAVVETDMCAVDAIQYLTGCTFGKGNLIHLDYGKSTFTFIRRSDGKAIRIALRPEPWRPPNPEDEALYERVRQGQASEEDLRRVQELREEQIQDILERPLAELFEVQPVEAVVPARARIHDSVTCAGCGERVMETRARLFQGEMYCIPCFETRERQS